MAKKQSNVGMMERAGYALGQSNLPTANMEFSKALTQSFKAKVSKKEAKSSEMLNKFPQGIEIAKVPEGLRPKITEWVISKKQEFVDAAAIIAQGSSAPGYNEAIESQNNIQASILEMSKSLENHALTRQGAANRFANNSNAASMTDFEKDNFHNLYQGDYGGNGLNANIVDNKLTFVNSEGSSVNSDDFGGMIGTEYDYAAEDVLNELQIGIGKLGREGEDWDKEETKIALKKIARNPQAIKNLLHEKPQLMDNFVSNQLMKQGVNIPVTLENGEKNPEWLAYKNGEIGIENKDGVQAPGYVEYVDFNKTNENMGNGFVETMMNAYEKTYNMDVLTVKPN